MEQALRDRLKAVTAVTDLVGDQIDWGAQPQGGGLPALVLNVVSMAEGATLKGRDGLRSARVQVDCYAGTVSGVTDLREAVIDALHGYRSDDFQGVFFQGARHSREGGANEPVREYRAQLEFMVHWRQT